MYHAIVFLPLVGFLIAGLFGRVLGARPSEIITTALLFVAAYRLPGGVAAVVGAVGPLVVMGLTWTLDHLRPPALALVAEQISLEFSVSDAP